MYACVFLYVLCVSVHAYVSAGICLSRGTLGVQIQDWTLWSWNSIQIVISCYMGVRLNLGTFQEQYMLIIVEP